MIHATRPMPPHFRQNAPSLQRIARADVARSRRRGVNLTCQKFCYVLYLAMRKSLCTSLTFSATRLHGAQHTLIRKVAKLVTASFALGILEKKRLSAMLTKKKLHRAAPSS